MSQTRVTRSRRAKPAVGTPIRGADAAIEPSELRDRWSFPRAEALPTYAFVMMDQAKGKLLSTGADIIDLGLGNPDRGTPREIVGQLEAAARVSANHRYHPGRGVRGLREALSGWYRRRYDAAFDAEREVIVTMGAKEAISHLCLAILGPGTR